MTIIRASAFAALLLLIAACSSNATPTPTSSSEGTPTETAAAPTDLPTKATIVTSKGDIKAELFPAEAPLTVENFTQLASGEKSWIDPATGNESTKPLFDGLTFHRVIPDFMIQGGDPLGNGTGGPGYQFADEFGGQHDFSKPYVLAMANSGPDTNGSQFFITVAPTPWLDNMHTIFGQVSDADSQKVVQAISEVKTDANNDPVKPVIIKTINVG